MCERGIGFAECWGVNGSAARGCGTCVELDVVVGDIDHVLGEEWSRGEGSLMLETTIARGGAPSDDAVVIAGSQIRNHA